MEDNRAPIENGESAAGGEGEGQADPVQNLKGEFNRKFGNISEQLKAQNDAMQAILAQIQQSKPAPQPEPAAENMADLLYSDPEKAIAIIEERASKRAEQKVGGQLQASQAVTAVVNEMQSKYPEFGQEGSEAAKAAMTAFQRLPAHLKGTPEGARMAMLEAVSDLGLVPKSKRKNVDAGDDSFALGGSSTGQRPPRRQQSEAVSERTLEFAQLLGVDVKDPKKLESLKTRAQRKSWNRYE